MLRNPCVALFALAVVVCVVVASNAGLTRAQPVEKNQKVRPYQFGFTIDEQQHRFEKQDERGIVMGEFGFITADGIYHVTVYATDEEGKFRILAMKSYPYESPPKTIDMIVKPKAKTPTPTPTTTTTTTTTTATPLPKFNGNAKACSGCFIPKEGSNSAETTPPKTAIRTLSKSLPSEDETRRSSRLPGQSGGSSVNNPSLSNTAKSQTTNKASPTSTQAAGAQAPKTALVNAQKSAAASPGGTQQTQSNKSSNVGGSNRGAGSTNNNGRSASGSGTVSGTSGSKAPSSAADAGDLYRFKYLLDYNGHTETGARNGNKQGNFFAIGDDNVQRTVEYIANEFGFQPRISWRKLDSGTKLPVENSLKDYEFVWFRKDK